MSGDLRGTNTILHTKLSYEDADRTVRITSGTRGLSLNVSPNPATYGDTSGSTSLTLEEAEKVANDLLARVAEIRAIEAMNAPGSKCSIIGDFKVRHFQCDEFPDGVISDVRTGKRVQS